MYGQDVYYLPRDLVNVDTILNEDVPSTFSSKYKVEMYIENIDGFDGEGDLFSKFGVEIRDAATFIVARRRWTQTVARHNHSIDSPRPREGDLIYLPMGKKLFEIMHVEHEMPFYQLKNLPTYKLRCELFEYNDEQLDTGLEDIDVLETTGFTLSLTLQDSADVSFVVGNTLTQLTSSGVTITGEIVDYNDSDNTISLAHIGSDDSNFHMFTTGTVTSQDADYNTLTRTVTIVNESVGQVMADNDDFSLEQSSFLDFSESNPFGEPS